MVIAKKCTTAINVFRSCVFFAVTFCFACHFFRSCANFLYDSFVQFRSCATFFAVVHFVSQLCYFFAVVLIYCITTARVTIEKFWARRGRDAGETRARTFTNFDVGTVYFRHMGVQVSRICTIFYVESVLKIFASFTVITYVSNMYERIYLDQS